MNLENFLSQPIPQKMDTITEPEKPSDPVWLLQLRTALETSSPSSVMFDRRLVDVYWEIKDEGRALELIKKAATDLLDDIATGLDPFKEPKDLAEGYQITDYDIMEWLNSSMPLTFQLIVGQEESQIDHFVELIISVLNSEWYEELYQRKVGEVQQGFSEHADWERTKQSLMPTWTP